MPERTWPAQRMFLKLPARLTAELLDESALDDVAGEDRGGGGAGHRALSAPRGPRRRAAQSRGA